MLRFYLIAALIVLVVGVLGAAVQRTASDLQIKSVQSTASPSPPRSQSESTFTPGPLTGDAPWVLSALPDCFHQERTFRGPMAAVRKHLPKDARLLQAITLLESGPCFAYVYADDAGVFRGPLGNLSVEAHIPPHLRIFVEGGPANPEQYGPRTLYVLRWASDAQVRLDRLSTESDARISKWIGKV